MDVSAIHDRFHEPVADILTVLAQATPRIRRELTTRRDRAGATNVHGEHQLDADVWADEHLETELTKLESVGTYASEEQEHPTDAGEGLCVAVDPLDGSSNLRSNNTMGTIAGIYDPQDGSLPASGRDLVASAFTLLGPITTMVATDGDTVVELLITEDGVDVLQEDLQLPTTPTVYGFGGRIPDWTPAFRRFARGMEEELKLRYGGSMIGDVNQVLTYGGLFAYPALQSRPAGKLRLQFEANPMAHIVETAGGASSDGTRPLLDVEPTDLHQRVPVHLGNRHLVEELEEALDGERKTP